VTILVLAVGYMELGHAGSVKLLVRATPGGGGGVVPAVTAPAAHQQSSRFTESATRVDQPLVDPDECQSICRSATLCRVPRIKL